MLALITAAQLAALSQIESGDRDAAIGAQGEISRYQIKPELFQAEADRQGIPSALPWDPRDAERIARAIWTDRLNLFLLAYHDRPPTAEELYLLWHRPQRVLNPKPRELVRARRFANLLSSISKTTDSSDPSDRSDKKPRTSVHH